MVKQSGLCYATVDGNYGGKRYGCATDSDCCNNAAKCGIDQLCRLTCWVSDPSVEQEIDSSAEDSGWFNSKQGQLTILLLSVSIIALLVAAFGVLCCTRQETETEKARRELERDKKWMEIQKQNDIELSEIERRTEVILMDDELAIDLRDIYLEDDETDFEARFFVKAGHNFGL